MPKPLTSFHAPPLHFWIFASVIAIPILLQFLLINDLTPVPRWMGQSLEIALLAALLAVTALVQFEERRKGGGEPLRADRNRRIAYGLAVALTAVVSAVTFGALFQLVRALLVGHSANGESLLLDALNIWSTNVIVFALWFWGLDRGGPERRNHDADAAPELLFAPMTMGREGASSAFVPGFVDYLYLSFTNATAFSPTDTLPLSQRMKLLMMLEAAVSLLTVALVAARAVNILA